MRYRFHVVLVVVALLVTSGCTLPGGGDLTANAGSVSVNNSTLNATGYAANESATVGLNKSIGIAGKNRTIGVKNEIKTYKHTGHKGRLILFSTPNLEVKGTSMNPFANRSERRDVVRMLGGLNNASSLTVKSRQNITMLGNQTELVTYTTTNRSSSGSTAVVVHTAVAQKGGDTVVAVGVHPQSVNGSGAMKRLIENIEHGK